MLGKSRSIVKLIALPLAFTALVTLIGVTPLPQVKPVGLSWYLLGLAGSAVALGLTYLFLKSERSSFGAIGILWSRQTLQKFIVGLIMGALLVTIMLLAIIQTTELVATRHASVAVLPAILWSMAFIPLAVMEEVAFRGYTFIGLTQKVGLRWTQLIVAILFAYYHDASGATFLSQLLGPGIWALVFGMAAVWSDGLALPIGLHAAVNMVQAFLGMKGDSSAIWTLDYTNGETVEAAASVQTVGLVAQLFLLVIGIVATEYYIRTRKKTNVYYY